MKFIQIGATYVNFDNLVKFHVGRKGDFGDYFFEGVSTGGEFVSVSMNKDEAEDLLDRISEIVGYRVKEKQEPTPPPLYPFQGGVICGLTENIIPSLR